MNTNKLELPNQVKQPLSEEREQYKLFAITLKRSPTSELAQHNWVDKYDILLKKVKCQREKLITWLSKQGLRDEVSEIGEPTVFNILPIVCTQNVAKQLSQAPGVVSVSTNQVLTAFSPN
jgi:hypothetical protein